MEAQARWQDQELNLPLLDILVEEFLYCHGCLRYSKEETEPRVKEHRRLSEQIESVEKLLRAGKIIDAVKVVYSLDPLLLADTKLLFNLHRHQFASFLRAGDVAAALTYCREHFGPFALQSDPEAYPLFKKSLLLLLYAKDGNRKKKRGADSSESSYSPLLGAASPLPWSSAELEQLSATIRTSLSYSCKLHDCSRFSLLLRYLHSIHNQYHILQGMQTAFPECEYLVMQDRRPPPLPRLLSVPPDFWHTSFLPGLRPDGTHSLTPEPMELDTSTSVVAEPLPPPPPLSPFHPSQLHEADIQMLAQAVSISRDDAVNGLKYAEGDVGVALLNELSRIQINTTDLLEHAVRYLQFRGCLSKDRLQTECEAARGWDDKLQVTWQNIRRVCSALRAGKIEESLQACKSLAPACLDSNPSLLLEIRFCEFSTLVNRSEFSAALRALRQHIAPLSINSAAYTIRVKKAMTALALQRTEEFGNQPNPGTLQRLSDQLFSAICRALLIEEPLLIRLMRYLLKVHTEWFKMQMCSDRFDTLFDMTSLKHDPSVVLSASTWVPPEVKQETPFDETSILTLMEFMNVSRSESIGLLYQFAGSVEDAMNVFMG